MQRKYHQYFDSFTVQRVEGKTYVTIDLGEGRGGFYIFHDDDDNAAERRRMTSYIHRHMERQQIEVSHQ